MRFLARLLFTAILLLPCEPPEVKAEERAPVTFPASPDEVTANKPFQIRLPPPLPEIDAADFSALQGFYARSDRQAMWVGPDGTTAAGEVLRARLSLVHDAGYDQIGPLMSSVRSRMESAGEKDVSALEFLLSAALLRVAVNPADPASPSGWPEVLESAGSSRDRLGFLRGALPLDPGFWRLRRALPTYRAIEAAGGWPVTPPGPNLELGATGPRVEALKRRLRAGGDLSESEDHTPSFGGELDAAVRRFQARHGLLVDGIVGPKTLAALNTPVAHWRATIELNLRRRFVERREWGARYIAVNAAAATYRLVEPGRPVRDQAAIVGRPSWPTPVLDSVIDRLEFNPYWTVPPRILRLEIMPKIERDPGYLSRNDMRWVGGQLRQNPGPRNPLGQVKFLFDNPYSVYLHDTDNRRLFERAERFLSHGCVRISGALDLARRLLAEDPAWSSQRIDEVLQGGRNHRVELSAPIPVHIAYDTAWADEAGTLHFRNDVYGRDRRANPARADAPSFFEASCPSAEDAS